MADVSRDAEGNYVVDGVTMSPAQMTPELQQKYDAQMTAPRVVAPLMNPMAAAGSAMPGPAAGGPAAAPVQADPAAAAAPLQDLAATPLAQPAAQPQGDVTVREGQVQKGLKLSDEVGKKIGDSYAQAEAGAQLKAEADIKASLAEAKTLDEDHDAVQSIIAQRKNAAIQWAKERDRLNKEIDDRRAAAEAKIDPNRMWQEMDGGRKALALIGIALSSFASNYLKTPNTAVEMLNNAISRDIDAQKASISNAQRGIEQRESSLRALMQSGMQEDEALLTQGKLMRESLVSRLKAMAARAKVPAIQGAFLETAAGLERAGARDLVELEKLKQDKVTTAWKTLPAAMQGGKTPDQEKERREWQEYYRKAAADKESPGGRYLAAVQDVEDFKAFRESGAASAAVMNFIAVGLKQGSFGPNLKAMADSPSTFEAAVEAARKMLAGGERPEFLNQIQKALIAREKIAAHRAQDFVRGMTEHQINPREILGTPTDNEKAAQTGGSYERPK